MGNNQRGASLSMRLSRSKREDSKKLYFEDSNITGLNIQAEPEPYDFKISCPFCKKLNFDDGLGNPRDCDNCLKAFISMDGEGKKLNEQNSNKRLEENKLYLNEKNGNPSRLPEILHLVLYCNRENLPKELIKEDCLDFDTIIKKIILPFFSIKSRAVKMGSYFKIGNFEFKAISCQPKIGRVTRLTKIHCYQDYNPNQILKKIYIGVNNKSKKTKLSEDDVKTFFTRMNSKIHISLDQIIYISDSELKIISATPHNGRITSETKIEFESEPLKEIKKLIVTCSYEQLLKIEPDKIEKIPKKELETILERRYVRPYFQGINRFLEKGSIFIVEKFQFAINDCKPSRGIVTTQTQIITKVADFRSMIQENSSENSDEDENDRIEYGDDMGSGEIDEESKSNPNEDIPRRSSSYEPEEENVSENDDDSRFEGLSNSSRNFLENPYNSMGSMNLNEQSRRALLNNLLASSAYLRASDLYQHLSPFFENLRNQINSDNNNNSVRSPNYTSSVSSKGATEFEMNRLPERPVDILLIKEKQLLNEEGSMCMICIEDYEQDDIIKTMPCMHYFHKQCLVSWLEKSKKCPLCMTPCSPNISNLFQGTDI